MHLTDKQISRFWAKVDRRGPNECWPWIAAFRPSVKYGYVSINGKSLAATHVALTIDGRVRPSPAHCARHSCHNPPCCNPAHLKWGTQWENAVDAFERGTAQRLWTDDQADQIRSDPRPVPVIAAGLGVDRERVYRLKRGESYFRTANRPGL